MRWLYHFSPFAGLALFLVNGWGHLLISAAGRTKAWWGMMLTLVLALPIAILNILDASGAMDTSGFKAFHLPLYLLSALHAVFFAIYVSRMMAQADQAKALEEECADLSLRLAARRNLPGASPVANPGLQ